MAGRRVIALRTLKLAGGRAVTFGDHCPELEDSPSLPRLVRSGHVAYADALPKRAARSAARLGLELTSAVATHKELKQSHSEPSENPPPDKTDGGFFSGKSTKRRAKDSAAGK